MIPTRNTVSIICIFCFMVARHVINSLHSFINLVVVMCVCVFHCNDETRVYSKVDIRLVLAKCGY